MVLVPHLATQQSLPRLANPMVPVSARIVRRQRETRDTFTLTLTRTDDKPCTFKPGQYNMLYVFGVGEVPISISGHPDKPSVIQHTTRIAGTVTSAMGQLRVGDVVGLRGPFGRGWPVDHAEGRDVVIIAGGIGLAPLRPVIYHLLAHRNRYGRVAVLYGARTPDDLIYRREVERWSSRLDVEVFATVDRATRGWYGNVGVITPLLKRAPFNPDNLVAMVCGPEIMMHVTARELQRQGVDASSIYVSMERNMKCALGLCGHCQFGPSFVCKDGPVLRFDTVEGLFSVREV